MLVLTLMLAPSLTGAGDLESLSIGAHTFHRRELANGLRAVAVHDEQAAVSIFMTVGVGNRQETANTTGLAHLVEHALFTGTSTTGTDEHERRVAAWGGESNAFTRDDYTVYYDHNVPAEHLSTLLAMEADRLVNLTLEPAPVLHERQRLKLEEAYTYQPSEGRVQQLEAAAFRVHPYGAGVRDKAGHTRAPELGVEQVRAFYQRYYHPNNVSVVVVGPQPPAAVLDAIEAAFGGLARGPQIDAPEPEPWFEERTERLPSQLPRDRWVLTWLIPERGDRARAALEVLAQWLERQELPDGRPVQASCGVRIDRDLFQVAASGAGAAQGLSELIARTRDGFSPSPADLEQVVGALARDVEGLPLRARPYFSLAGTFGVYEVHRQAELLTSRGSDLAAVDAETVQAMASRYLTPERCVTVVFEGTGAAVEPLPRDLHELYAAASEAAETGAHERAIEAFTRLLAAKPNRMNTVIYLATRGQVHADRRDFDAAIADYEAALAVVDYPAVRTMLEEALARKSAVMRGELEAGNGAEEPVPEPPPAGDLRAELLESVEESMAALETWRGLRFMSPVEPEFVDLAADEKLGGWYEASTGRLVVVLGKGAAFARGAQLHEICHALQDQTWDLSVLQAAARTTDERRALQGLTEGEAMLAVSELMSYDFEAHAQLPARGPLTRERFDKLYQYGSGLRFVRALRERGGWPAVNRAFGQVPKSTAEIFHPERYPRTAAAPSMDEKLAGEVLETDVLGEQELRWMLAATESTRSLTEKLGSAWRGDRWARVLAGGVSREHWDVRLTDSLAARRLFEEARAAWESAGWSAELSGASVRFSR